MPLEWLAENTPTAMTLLLHDPLAQDPRDLLQLKVVLTESKLPTDNEKDVVPSLYIMLHEVCSPCVCIAWSCDEG